MLKTDRTVFVLVDAQGKLAGTVYQNSEVLDNLKKLIKGLQVLALLSKITLC